MKNLTRRKNVFDFMQLDKKDDLSKKITESSEIDYRSVRSNAFEQLGLNPKTKKPFRKKIAVMLAASLSALAVIGTVVGASGQFHTAFGNYFTGESSGELYGGSNVSLKVKEGYRAALLGITGDETGAYIAVELSNADGSDIVSDVNNSFVGESFPSITKDKTVQKDDFSFNMHLDREYEYIENNDEISNIGLGYGFDCSFSDTKTIKAIFRVNTDGIDPVGKDCKIVIDPKFYAYHIESVVCDYDVDSYVRDGYDLDSYPQSIADQYASLLNDDQILTVYHDKKADTFQWVIAERTVLNTGLDLSLTLDYEPSSNHLEPANNNLYEYNGAQLSVNDISVGAFSLKIKGESYNKDRTDGSDCNELFNRFMHTDNVYLTLKDGTNIQCRRYGGFSPYYFDWGSDWHFTGLNNTDVINDPSKPICISSIYTYSNDNDENLVIDPNDVVSVTFGDRIITK